MKKTILLSLITIGFLNAEMTMAEKRKILEQKLFAKMSKKKQNSKEFYLPLKVNDILQDEIFVKIDNQENILITKDTLKYLASLMKDEYKKKFKKEVDAEGFTPLSSVEQMGITAKYDRQNIMLDIFLPVNLKKASLINFNRSGHKRDVNGSVLPKDFSGGANFYLNQQYSKNSSTSGFEKNALNLSSDVHLNVHGFVLEGRLQYNEEEGEVTKGRFRVVTDDAENQLRYQAGDISLPAHDKMSFVNALGIGVEKIFNIGSGYTQNITRINSHEFFIQNRSRVEIYVNDRYRNALNLAGGTHNLFDLNLPSGLNRIKLVVIEDGGKIEVIEFNDFSYSEVLQKGVARYGAGAGIESEQRENEWIYNKKRKVASAYIEYGLLDDITVEGGLQAGEAYSAGSAELLIGTNFGLFNPYVVASKKEGTVGYKKGLDYRTNLGDVTLNLGYEDIDANYALLGVQQSEATTLYRGSLYSQVGMGVSLGVSASSYTRDDEKEDKYGLVLRKNFGNLSTELNIDQINKVGENDTQIYATLDYRFGERYNARYVSYLSDQKHQLNLRRNAEGRYGVNTDLQFETHELATNYNLRADMNNEKFRIDGSYLNSQVKGSQTSNETLGLQLATGFVFAGTKATITAPINSSFVIVDNDDKLDPALGLNGYHEVDEFVYDSFAVDLSDYSERELFVDESALDFGVDLQDSKQKFLTNYKTGAVMDVVVENFYSIKGSFYDNETRKPLGHKAFKVFNTDTGERSTSFTNDKGEFVINHVGVGSYNVSFVKERAYKGVARHNFFIKEDEQKSLMDMGRVYLEMPEKKEIKKHLVYNKKSNKPVSQLIQNVLKNIYFANNSYAIDQNEEKKLNKLAVVLKQYSELKIDIIGHTDKRGSDEYNMELSYQRAKSVKEYLVQQGIRSRQLSTLGMGSKQAIYDTDKKNRRTEFANQVVFQVQ
jgi:outer membrane protein OmpA-like peptidoglycan-associated protein